MTIHPNGPLQPDETRPVMLQSIVDWDDLQRHVAEGLVSERVHPQFDQLRIWNYTPKAVIDGSWSDVSRRCRGLIANLDTGEVLARPPAKFFNWGESIAETPGPDDKITVADKLDGSLITAYTGPDGQVWCASRGSFASEQAMYATELWRKNHAGQKLSPVRTAYFELITGWNRIVVDYGDVDDLVLLGTVHRLTGNSQGPKWSQAHLSWTGLVAEEFAFKNVDELLKAPPRDNAEGYVISWGHDKRVKLKYDEYVKLHRIRFEMTPKRVWEYLSSGQDVKATIEPLPEAIREEISDIVGKLWNQHCRIRLEIEDEWRQVEHLADGPRKDFAMAAGRLKHRAALFGKLDGFTDRVIKYAWDQIKPSGEVRPPGRDEVGDGD